MVFVLWLRWALCRLVAPEGQPALLGHGGRVGGAGCVCQRQNSPKPTSPDPRNTVSSWSGHLGSGVSHQWGRGGAPRHAPELILK